MDKNEYKLFDDKSLSDVFKDIYSNQQNRKKEIAVIIQTLREYITTPRDVVNIGPIIKDLLDISVKNDEQLLKLATIAQRLLAAEHKTIGDDGYLTDDEKAKLLSDLDTVITSVSVKSDKSIDNIKERVEDLEDGK